MIAELPDGRRLEFPDGTDPAVIQATVKKVLGLAAPAKPTLGEQLKNEAMTSLPGGLVRGLKDVVDTGAGYLSKFGGSEEAARVQAMNQAGKDEFTEAQKMVGAGGSDVTRLAGNIVGTLPVGGALAAPLGLIKGAAPLATALRTGGMSAGGATGLGGLAARTAGGAGTGFAAAGMVDPEMANMGGALGGALPGVLKVAGAAGGLAVAGAEKTAHWLMQSALKPTIAQLKSGEAATAVKTLLDYGISANAKGVEKLKGLISGLNDEISTAVGSSTATIDKHQVLNALSGTRQKFGNQVSPTADLKAIQGIEDDFMLRGSDMSVKAAQEMKQGTYRILRGKYGQMGSAETEAQKSIARGLKDEIATAVPGVGALNAEESRLIATLGVAERRALMELNKNPLGLSALANGPVGWAAFMADKSAAFKSLAARMLNRTASFQAPANLNALAGPTVYRALPPVAGQN